MPSKQLHSEVLAGASETVKHQGPEGRHDLQKHLPRGLTSLLDSGKNKASSAAGPAGPAAAAAAAAAAGGAASLQNASLATPKHPATERRNNLQKHAAPRLDVPLDSGKNKATSTARPAAAAAAGAAGANAARFQNAFATPERPPKTCCPEAPRPNIAFWTDKKL